MQQSREKKARENRNNGEIMEKIDEGFEDVGNDGIKFTNCLTD